MKNLIFYVFVCLWLMGCQTLQPHKGNHYHKGSEAHLKKKSAKTDVTPNCVINCNYLYKKCLSLCHDNCRQCKREADNQAWKNFKKYCRRMKVKGTYRPRDWQSFRDPLQCRKVSCSCVGDLEVCVQQCGGKIKKKLLARPFCE